MQGKLKKNGTPLNLKDYKLNYHDTNASSMQLYKQSSHTLERGLRDDYDSMALPMTPYQIARYIATIVIVCVLTSLFISLFDVAFTQHKVVIRLREVALAELKQDCCRIFTTEMKGTGVTSFPKEKVNECHRILQQEKQQRGLNRCEAAEDVLGQSFYQQWVWHVWQYYFPLAKLSMFETLTNSGLMTISSMIGTYLLKKVVFQQA